MGKARDAFGLVLTGVRDKLLSGEIAPGQLLGIADLASEFRTSVTPVREALTRLTGEGLLVGTRRSGFARPQLPVEVVIDLIALHHAEVAWAVQILDRREGVPAEEVDPSGLRALAAESVFRHLVARASSAALSAAHRTTTLQLGPIWAIERAVLARVDEELLGLAGAARSGAWRCVSQGLFDYHARRTAAAADLAEAASARVKS